MPPARPAPPLATVLVGAGAMGREHLAAMDDVPELQLAAVVDADPEALSAFAGRAPGFGTVREMLAAMESARPQAAIVATPPATHEDLVIQLLGAGVHVLCEKPLATSAAAATRMFAASARQDRVLMMASRFRYEPDVVEAQRLVRDGLFGEVVWAEVTFAVPRDARVRWLADPKLAGGGVLIDLGTHAADLIRGFLGPVVRVFAHLGRRVQAVPVEDTVLVHAETGAGAAALARLSWSVDAASSHFLVIHGARGTLQLGPDGGRYRLHGQAEWVAFGSPQAARTTLARQLQDFAWLVSRPGHEPLIRTEDAIDSVRVIEAAYRAARVERWIPVHGYGGEFA